MVSNKMSEAVKHKVSTGSGLYADILNPSGTAQAAIDAAWHKFRPEDPDTWPESDKAPSGNPWLCLTPYERSGEHVCTGYWNVVRTGEYHRDIQGGYFSGPADVGWIEDTTAYADPADFMPDFVNSPPLVNEKDKEHEE